MGVEAPEGGGAPDSIGDITHLLCSAMVAHSGHTRSKNLHEGEIDFTDQILAEAINS